MCLERFIRYTDVHIGHQKMLKTPDMQYYSCLPLCAFDAIFSIRADYEHHVSPLIDRFCAALNLNRAAADPNEIPGTEQTTVSAFVRLLQANYGLIEDAGTVRNGAILATKIGNHQRTSTRGGILKADAFLRYLDVFRQFNIETFQDLNGTSETRFAIDQALRQIPGQNVAVDYFFMLAGENDMVKVDTHLRRYVQAAVEADLSNERIIKLFQEAAGHYRAHGFPTMTPRHLDHIVWSWQRNQPIGGAIPQDAKDQKKEKCSSPESKPTEYLQGAGYLQKMEPNSRKKVRDVDFGYEIAVREQYYYLFIGHKPTFHYCELLTKKVGQPIASFPRIQLLRDNGFNKEGKDYIYKKIAEPYDEKVARKLLEETLALCCPDCENRKQR